MEAPDFSCLVSLYALRWPLQLQQWSARGAIFQRVRNSFEIHYSLIDLKLNSPCGAHCVKVLILWDSYCREHKGALLLFFPHHRATSLSHQSHLLIPDHVKLILDCSLWMLYLGLLLKLQVIFIYAEDACCWEDVVDDCDSDSIFSTGQVFVCWSADADKRFGHPKTSVMTICCYAAAVAMHLMTMWWW